MAPTNVPSAPTTLLPSLAKLHSFTLTEAFLALDGLRELYWPTNTIQSTLNPQNFAVRQRFAQKSKEKTRISRLVVEDAGVVDSGYASAEENEGEEDSDDEGEDEAERLRSDSLERAFAIRWLTGFIARSDGWYSCAASAEDEDARYSVVDEASTLLSSFTGSDSYSDPSEAAVSRSFSFHLCGGKNGLLVDVTLNDEPLSDEDHTSVGLQSWGASIVLAEMMCADPSKFDLIAGRSTCSRILELGAGTGLLSIVAAKIIGPDNSAIVATDFHADVLKNLQVNVDSNFPGTAYPTSPIHVRSLNWEDPDLNDYVQEGKFHSVLAADVIYHPNHALWIKKVVEAVMVRPSVHHPGGTFWLAIPRRTTGRHEDIDKTVDLAFRVSERREGSGPQLGIIEQESIARQSNIGRADESGYRLFKIGWI